MDERERTYRQFAELNQRFKMFVTQWQLEHISETRLDAIATARMADIDEKAHGLLQAMATWDPDFGHFGPRLRNARCAVEHDRIEYLASPLVDSYHTVWFEWHEKLLTSLGLDREE